MNEIYCDDNRGSPAHEWRIESRLGDREILVDGEARKLKPFLQLRCQLCGAWGIVGDPSPAEVRRAAKPHRWFAVQRIGMVGRTEAIDQGSFE